jgi:ABC-2 type transport system ATP-binding protein
VTGRNAIATRGLGKRYGSKDALIDLDLEVHRGEVFGCLGPNGAGKTTTIRLLLGLIHPTSGGAEVLGLDPWRDAVALHRRLAYLSGDLALWPTLTGAQTLEYLGALHGSVDVAFRDELIERFGLDPSVKIRAYSRGNRQKVGIIAALMGRPELLVLDEPTTGLDPLMEQVFRECLHETRERGQTVFLSSHILSEVEAVCDRVGILRSGRLVEVGSIARMRRLAAVEVVATFSSKPPDVKHVDGVHDVHARGHTLRCKVTGPVGPLVDALAGHGLLGLTSREPSLEELFLAHYGDQAS